MSTTRTGTTTRPRWSRSLSSLLTAAGAALAVAAATATSQAHADNPGPNSPPSALPCPITVNQENWTSAGGSYLGTADPGCMTDGFFVVHLSGAVRQISSTGGNPSVIAQLSPKASPSRPVYTIASTAGGSYVDVTIWGNGQIQLTQPHSPAVTDFSFVSLDGIQFPLTTNRTAMGAAVALCAPSSTSCAGSLNTGAYAPGGWGAAWPGYYLDTWDGTVHLVGGVTHKSSSGDWQIGTLPAEARPDRTVYTIAHTFNGTFADVSIDSGGNIDLLSPLSPAVTDFSFVSLEGISYRLHTPPYPLVALNNASYSPGGGGTSTPGVVQGLACVNYLTGAATQVTPPAGDQSVIGTLPGGAGGPFTPHRNVYTTMNIGPNMYADVVIGSDGVIRVDAPPPLWAGSIFDFVSLEGISWTC